MLQCFNSVSNNEAGIIPKFIVFFCPTAMYKRLTYADVLCCYEIAMFVDVRLASLTLHAASVRILPSEMSNDLGLLCH